MKTLKQGRHSYVSGEWRGSKNNKLYRPNLEICKQVEYTQDIPASSKNSKKVGPISVECIGPKIKKGPEFEMVSLSLETVKCLNDRKIVI